MKKLISILLIVVGLIFAFPVYSGQQQMLISISGLQEGEATCSTCATGLVQAFILDNGSADLDDYVGDNNLTLAASTADPAFHAGDNIGLEFDGDDYASYTPLLIQWQAGATVAILVNVPNVANNTFLNQNYSSDTDHRISLQTPSTSAYNRVQGLMGTNASAAEVNIYSSDGSTSKQWIFLDYDGSSTAELFRDTTSKGTDATVSEYSSTNMNQGRLGSTVSGVNFYTGTIYKVFFYTRELTNAERVFIVGGWVPTKD